MGKVYVQIAIWFFVLTGLYVQQVSFNGGDPLALFGFMGACSVLAAAALILFNHFWDASIDDVRSTEMARLFSPVVLLLSALGISLLPVVRTHWWMDLILFAATSVAISQYRKAEAYCQKASYSEMAACCTALMAATAPFRNLAPTNATDDMASLILETSFWALLFCLTEWIRWVETSHQTSSPVSEGSRAINQFRPR